MVLCHVVVVLICPTNGADDCVSRNYNKRGSKFLKDWMEFLEEHADLRYPDLASLAGDDDA